MQQALSQGIAETFDVPVVDVFILGISSYNATSDDSSGSGARMLSSTSSQSTIDFIIYMPNEAASQNVLHQLSNPNATAASLFVAMIMVAAVAADTTGILATVPPLVISHATTAVVVVSALPSPYLSATAGSSIPVWEMGVVGGVGGLALIASLAVIGRAVAVSSRKKRLAALASAAMKEGGRAVDSVSASSGMRTSRGVGIEVHDDVGDGGEAAATCSPTALPITIAPLATGDDSSGDRFWPPVVMADRPSSPKQGVYDDDDDDELFHGEEGTRRSSRAVVSIIPDMLRGGSVEDGSSAATSRVAPISTTPPPGLEAAAGVAGADETAVLHTGREGGVGIGHAAATDLRRIDITTTTTPPLSSIVGTRDPMPPSSLTPKVQQLRAPLRPSHSVSSSGVGSSLLPPALPLMSLRKLHKQGTFGLGTAMVTPAYSPVVPGPALTPLATDAAIENLLVPAARHARRASLSSVHAAYRRMYADAELAHIIDNLLPAGHERSLRPREPQYVNGDAEELSAPTDMARVLGFESAYTEGVGPDAQSQMEAPLPSPRRAHAVVASPTSNYLASTAGASARRGSLNVGLGTGIVDVVTPQSRAGSLRRMSMLSVSAAQRASMRSLRNAMAQSPSLVASSPASTITSTPAITVYSPAVMTSPPSSTLASPATVITSRLAVPSVSSPARIMLAPPPALTLITPPVAGVHYLDGTHPLQQKQQHGQGRKGQWAPIETGINTGSSGGHNKDNVASTGAIIEELRNAFKYSSAPTAIANTITVAAAAIESSSTNGARGRALDRGRAAISGASTPGSLQRNSSGRHQGDRSPTLRGDAHGSGSIRTTVSSGRRVSERPLESSSTAAPHELIAGGLPASSSSSTRRISILRTAQTALSPAHKSTLWPGETAAAAAAAAAATAVGGGDDGGDSLRDQGQETAGLNRVCSRSPERMLVARPQGNGHVTTLLVSRGAAIGERGGMSSLTRRTVLGGQQPSSSTTSSTTSSSSSSSNSGGSRNQREQRGGGGGGLNSLSPTSSPFAAGASERGQQGRRGSSRYLQAASPMLTAAATAYSTAEASLRGPCETPTSSTDASTHPPPRVTDALSTPHGPQHAVAAGPVEPSSARRPSLLRPALLRLPSGKVLNPVLQNSPYRPNGMGTSTRRLSLGSSSRQIAPLRQAAAAGGATDLAPAPLSVRAGSVATTPRVDATTSSSPVVVREAQGEAAPRGALTRIKLHAAPSRGAAAVHPSSPAAHLPAPPPPP